MTYVYKDQSFRFTQIQATYALCLFENLDNVGKKVGVLDAMLPSRSGDISELTTTVLFFSSIYY